MFGIMKSTVEDITLVLASILLFNGLVNLPTIGKYLQQYPLIIVVVALLMMIFKKKIGETLGV